MSAYNFRLHDALIEALQQAAEAETQNLAQARNADFGEYRHRIGRIGGLRHAIEIAEETRQKLMKE